MVLLTIKINDMEFKGTKGEWDTVFNSPKQEGRVFTQTVMAESDCEISI